MTTHCETNDLLVFSHLRWDFVFQRPQHLLSRHAKFRRVFYFEEPVFGMTDIPRLHLRETTEGVQVVIPYLPSSIKAEHMEEALRDLVDELVFEEDLSNYTLFYYTPMAMGFTRHLEPVNIIFDKMDELSLFKNAPQALLDREEELMRKSSVVFTGGQSMYEAAKHRHHNIHPFPSAIDYDHFAQGRDSLVEPADQMHIPRPRLGFYGVIDERFNIELLREMAELQPDYHFVMIGPVVKIDPASLPQGPNIHYLGKKDYSELPLYLSGWDCAIMPFALNDSTRFISPTKTPEFLAAGKPTVSTSITDVVSPYGESGLVHIADTASEFVACCERAMTEKAANPTQWLAAVDEFLADKSWDMTFERMARLEKELPKVRILGAQIQTVSPSKVSANGVM
jgi:UDP-galactopyranose mutase